MQDQREANIQRLEKKIGRTFELLTKVKTHKLSHCELKVHCFDPRYAFLKVQVCLVCGAKVDFDDFEY